MEVYSENDGPAKLNREERVRVAGMLKGKTAMAGMDLIDVRKAIARAPRKELDAAGKRRRLGGNVASFLVQLLTWEGSGELDDYYIHRTKREWFESEAALTEAMVKTARKTAREEGLVDYEQTYRPNDRRPTTAYRLDMWQFVRLVIRSELDNVTRMLAHGGHKRERDKLNRKRRELERARDDLNLFEERDSGNPEPKVESGQLSPQTGPTSPPYRRVHQEVTSVDTDVSTPVGEDAEAEKIMNEIYHRMKEVGYRLDNEEYAFNLARVRSLLSEDDPTDEQLENLPDACVEYFEWAGKPDAAKALRRMRQQARRSARIANGEADGTPQRKGSPPEVVEALIARGGFHKKTLALVAKMWDFTREEQPPWWVKKECGGTDLERHDNVRRLRNLAHKTMRKLHAEPPVTESARTSSPDPAEHKGKRLPVSPRKLHALSCAMFPVEGEDGLSRMAAARLSDDPGCPTTEQIAERARGVLGDPAPSLEDVAAAVELVLKGRRWEMEKAG